MMALIVMLGLPAVAFVAYLAAWMVRRPSDIAVDNAIRDAWKDADGDEE